MKRSIWAVLVGFIFIAVMAGGSSTIVRMVSPRSFGVGGGTRSVPILLLMTVLVGIFATVGSYLTARLSPSSPMKHALVLGGLGLLLNLVGSAMTWSLFPSWYTILNLVLVMAYAWLGGKLREDEIGTVAVAAAT